MDRSRVAIVIPALNEAETISNVVGAVFKYGVPIVVDDGSTDDTSLLSNSCGAVVVSHENNLGYDAAINSGFLKAKNLGCEYVITIDADGQHNPDMLENFIALLDAGADVVVGNRDKLQRIAEYVFSWVGRYCWQINDPLCGMKAYRLSIYEEVGYFDSYTSIGTELVIYAARKKKNIKQLSILTRERKGVARFGEGFSANKKIFRSIVYAFFK